MDEQQPPDELLGINEPHRKTNEHGKDVLRGFLRG